MVAEQVEGRGQVMDNHCHLDEGGHSMFSTGLHGAGRGRGRLCWTTLLLSKIDRVLHSGVTHRFDPASR